MTLFNKLILHFAALLCAVSLGSCKTEIRGKTVKLQIQTGASSISDYISILNGKSVAIVANHTSLIGKTPLVDTLLSLNIRIVRIFSPEHGYAGTEGAGSIIENNRSAVSQIPVFSLYGNRNKKPTPESLQDVDIVVYDLQDVGVRFYTYISTMHYVMEACAENRIPLVILDRPNPLGFYVDGPVLDTCFRSFVGMHPIPVVYGMTAGELASMINGEGWLKNKERCDLTVIHCKNYTHDSIYTLPVSPSPNLNSMEAIYLYPSLCFFEGTIMSVGRGTDFPFRVTGHPDYPVKDFSFIPKPNQGNDKPLYMNQICHGKDFTKLTADSLRKIRQINLPWLIEIYKTMQRGDHFFSSYFDLLAGNETLRHQILQGLPENQIRLLWNDSLVQFMQLRSKYLLYEDFRK